MAKVSVFSIHIMLVRTACNLLSSITNPRIHKAPTKLLQYIINYKLNLLCFFLFACNEKQYLLLQLEVSLLFKLKITAVGRSYSRVKHLN
jgi:hypothetical protein